MNRTVALLAAIAALIAAWPAQASETQDYLINPTGDAIAVCAGEDVGPGEPAPPVPSPANISGVCFTWTGSKSDISIAIDDVVTGNNVGFYWQWYRANGDVIVDEAAAEDPVTGYPAIWGDACAPHTIPIIPQARRIKIWLDGPAFGPLDCGLAGGGSPGIATTGSVTATIK